MAKSVRASTVEIVRWRQGLPRLVTGIRGHESLGGVVQPTFVETHLLGDLARRFAHGLRRGEPSVDVLGRPVHQAHHGSADGEEFGALAASCQVFVQELQGLDDRLPIEQFHRAESTKPAPRRQQEAHAVHGRPDAGQANGGARR
jgi:hypothetical protein